MTLVLPSIRLRPGIELGFYGRRALVYDGTEPVAIDAQAGKGKLTRFLGVNVISPRTAHLSKIITDPKDGELAWATWKTLEREGYRVRFINPDKLYGYPSETYNTTTQLLDVAATPQLHHLLWRTAYDAASYLVPVDPNPTHRWIGQGVRTAFATYYLVSALYPDKGHSCTAGGLWDFFGRDSADIADELNFWACDERLANIAGMCQAVAGFTKSPNQWNAYASLIIERLQGFQKGSAAREATDSNSFDPAEMKSNRTALFIIGSAQSDTSRTFVGSMASSIIDRVASRRGPLRTLVVGEEWGQLYVSTFPEILTLYRDAGINFLGVFQNGAAQIETKYGKELSRLWRKAVAHTIYRGLPDDETLRSIEHRSGKTSVFVHGVNASNQQVNGSGDSLGEQARPLLQVEDIRRLTGGSQGLLDSRDAGFFTVDMPNYWERPQLAGMIRDLRTRPDKYAWLKERSASTPPEPSAQTSSDSDADIQRILWNLQQP